MGSPSIPIVSGCPSIECLRADFDFLIRSVGRWDASEHAELFMRGVKIVEPKQSGPLVGHNEVDSRRQGGVRSFGELYDPQQILVVRCRGSRQSGSRELRYSRPMSNRRLGRPFYNVKNVECRERTKWHSPHWRVSGRAGKARNRRCRQQEAQMRKIANFSWLIAKKDCNGFGLTKFRLEPYLTRSFRRVAPSRRAGHFDHDVSRDPPHFVSRNISCGLC